MQDSFIVVNTIKESYLRATCRLKKVLISSMQQARWIGGTSITVEHTHL